MPKLLSIGSSCLATHVADEIDLYAGRSPLDWTLCKPISMARIVACLYTHTIEEFLDKFFTFQEKGPKSAPDNDTAHTNYNKEFDIYAPHHEGKYADYESHGQYSPSENTREKCARRAERLLSILKDKDDPLYLLYVGDIFPTEDKPYEDLMKVRNLISLFRPLDTFHIIYIDTNHTAAAPPEIECLISRQVPKHTYWIYPCQDVLFGYFESKGVKAGKKR